MVGCGAIGSALLRLLQTRPQIQLQAVVVRPGREAEVHALLRSLSLDAAVVTQVPADGLDLLLEVGGHSAVAEHAVPALQRGLSCVLASVGALASAPLLAAVQTAAQQGGAQAHLIPGAVGGIDALAAARLGGLDEVIYTGRKAPSAWRGTPAEALVALDQLDSPALIFEGTAREAATAYPKNANVTATIALAGLGFDATRLRLFADPGVRQNVHRLQARGAFGELDVTVSAHPLSSNPKTSALTVYSALRALMQRVDVLSL
ncbi:MAG: aspartate dehydrogenase [Burkholderiaceae bacterium]|nr:aspartate dehydrogenase [Burkholderiaceae bacterium]